MTLSKKISKRILLVLFAAMLISGVSYIFQAYFSFKRETLMSARNSLDIFQALHIQAMLNRGTVEDNDPAIATLNGTLAQLSANKDRYAVWAVMAPTVISFQRRNGHEELEPPLDDIDRDVIRTGAAVGRMVEGEAFRLSVPVVLGEGYAANARCFECHGDLMGQSQGDVIGAYSISLSTKHMWADFTAIVKIAGFTSFFVLLIMSGISILLLRRMVSEPITSMTHAMRRLADGDTSIKIPHEEKDDEIGEMAKALNVFKENARELIFQKLALDKHAIVSSTDVKGNITYANDKFCEISGYSRDDLIGQNHRLLKSDEHSLKFYKDMWRTIGHGRIWHGDVKNWKKDGSEYWLKATIVPFLDESGKPFQYVSIRTDITDQRQAVKLKVMAHHDHLTGLPNRNLFGDRLMLAIAEAKRRGGQLAFMYLDLDKFKPINDKLGHGIGDEVLKRVARRLKENIREIDTVARIGGDEFAVILAPPITLEDSKRTAERLLEVLSEPIHVKGHECAVSASVGVSLYPEDATDLEELVKCGDAAMYRVKDSGRNGVEFYGNPGGLSGV
jgi:diguanylate cyclase (GGDEF)-like protein/PAS domain S-box-containing protein